MSGGSRVRRIEEADGVLLASRHVGAQDHQVELTGDQTIKQTSARIAQDALVVGDDDDASAESPGAADARLQLLADQGRGQMNGGAGEVRHQGFLIVGCRSPNYNAPAIKESMYLSNGLWLLCLRSAWVLRGPSRTRLLVHRVMEGQQGADADLHRKHHVRRLCAACL